MLLGIAELHELRQALTSFVPSLKPMRELRVFLNSIEKRMYAVLGRFGASASLLALPMVEGELTWGTTEGEGAHAVGGAKGGGEVGASCFRVISYLAFSIAYLSRPHADHQSNGGCHCTSCSLLHCTCAECWGKQQTGIPCN